MDKDNYNMRLTVHSASVLGAEKQAVFVDGPEWTTKITTREWNFVVKCSFPLSVKENKNMHPAIP